MARPRIFISSTYYDLRNVRADLERFIREQGYDPVLFERGQVPYGVTESLEEDCYREIASCDILINIVGGKFGTDSRDARYSISQNELRTAAKLGKQIYIFVERAVYAEHGTYLANKTVKGFTPSAVNDLRVYGFLEELFALSGRNPIQPFEVTSDIIFFLREQWAGLLQMLLQEHARQKEVRILEKIEATAGTLNQLVDFLTKERKEGDATIRDILLSNHPVFEAIRSTVKVPYRVYFETVGEMDALLDARRVKVVDRDDWKEPDYRVYLADWPKEKYLVKVRADLFGENGSLKIMKATDWKDEFVSLTELPAEVDDDDLPF